MEAAGWKIAECMVSHRRTRSGRVLRAIGERYLRMDLPCLLEACGSCPKPEPAKQCITADAVYVLVPDAAALALQADVFASNSLKVLLIPALIEIHEPLDHVLHCQPSAIVHEMIHVWFLYSSVYHAQAPVLLLQSVLEELKILSSGSFARVARNLLMTKKAFLFMDRHHALLGRSNFANPSEALDACVRWYQASAPSIIHSSAVEESVAKRRVCPTDALQLCPLPYCVELLVLRRSNAALGPRAALDGSARAGDRRACARRPLGRRILSRGQGDDFWEGSGLHQHLHQAPDRDPTRLSASER